MVSNIYTLTKNFPEEEKYGLISQLQRAAISVPSNISEGCGRNTNPQISHFINIALGSLYQVETQVTISSNLNFIKEEIGNELLEEINQLKKMTRAFISSLE